MPITHGGSAATTALSLPRATFGCFSLGAPASSTPCSAKTFLARSIPRVTIAMTSPSEGADETSNFPSWHSLPVSAHADSSGRGSPFHSLGPASAAERVGLRWMVIVDTITYACHLRSDQARENACRSRARLRRCRPCVRRRDGRGRRHAQELQ